MLGEPRPEMRITTYTGVFGGVSCSWRLISGRSLNKLKGCHCYSVKKKDAQVLFHLRAYLVLVQIEWPGLT